jgi:hypothetical protein
MSIDFCCVVSGCVGRCLSEVNRAHGLGGLETIQSLLGLLS